MRMLARLLLFLARPPPPPPEPEAGRTHTAWLLACLVLTWLAIRRRVSRREEVPEGQRAVPLASALRLPFIGQIASTFRLGKDNMNYGLSRFGFRYGRDLVQADLGFIGKFIFVHGPEAVKQIFTTHPFTDGGKFVAEKGFAKIMDSLPGTQTLTYLFGNGLFVASDDDRWWPIAHRILVKPFSRQGMMSMVPLMNEQADLLVERLAKDLGDGVGPIRIYEYTVMMAVETLGVCCMGMAFQSFSGEPVPFLVELKKWLELNAFLGLVPPPFWFLFPKTVGQMKTSADFLKGFVKEVLERRRAGESQSLSRCPDLLDAMLENADSVTGEKLPDELICFEIMSFLFAGQDSTAVALSSLFCFVAANPSVQAKLVSELEEVVGESEHVEFRQLSKLKYLDWCIKETLRLVPPVPGIYKRAELDCAIAAQTGGKPYKIDKKTNLFLSFLPLHLDKQTWGADAAEFKPERWEAGPPHPYAYAPFSHGPRACIGKEFTLTEQKICAVKLLRRFIIAKTPDGWAPQPQSHVLRAAQHPHFEVCSVNFKMDVEFDPRQAFTGCNAPLELHPRPPMRGGARAASRDEAGPAANVHFALSPTSAGHQTPLKILFGSDGGSTTDLAEQLMYTAQELGFVPTVEPLNEAVDSAALKEPAGLFVLLSATYNGCPPANASDFVAWVKKMAALHERPVQARFAVFGCGHSNWAETFLLIPTLLDESMEQLGGRRLVPLAAADARMSPEADFARWEAKLWPALAAASGIALEERAAEPKVSAVEIVQSRSKAAPLALAFEREAGWALARVVEKRDLTDAKQDKQTIHLVFEAAAGQPALAYEPGDHLMVYGHNVPEAVAQLLARMGLDPDTAVAMPAQAGAPAVGRSVSASLGVAAPVRLESLLLRAVDLARPASAAAARLLSSRADAADAAALASADEPKLRQSRATVAELLENHPSVALSVAELLSCLAPMKPRHYSISSSPLVAPGRPSLTVGVVGGVSLTGRNHLGVCSNFLKSRRPGDAVWVRVKKGMPGFRPPSPQVPALMIGAGTGIAPFRGFLQHMQRSPRGAAAPVHLFYGCQSESRLLYAAELRALHAEGTLALHVALSRAAERVYVQELIRRQAQALWPLLRDGSHVYVCGDAARLAPAVKAALKAVVATAGGLGDAKAAAFVDQLCAVGPSQRYHEDVWAANA